MPPAANRTSRLLPSPSQGSAGAPLAEPQAAGLLWWPPPQKGQAKAGHPEHVLQLLQGPHSPPM